MHKNPYIGGDVDEYFEERGISQKQVSALTTKHILASLIEQRMQELGVREDELARRMGVSRAHVDLLLDEQDLNLTLDTLMRACVALDMVPDFAPVFQAVGMSVRAVTHTEMAAPKRRTAARKAPARSRARAAVAA